MRKPMKSSNTAILLRVVMLAVSLTSFSSFSLFGQAKPAYVKPEEAMKHLITPLGIGPPSFGVIRTARISGTVRVEFTILATGTVADITNPAPGSGSSGILFETMRGAVSQLLFRPYIQDGMPVAVRTSLQATYAGGGSKWDWSDPSSVPPAAPAALPAGVVLPTTIADLTTTTSQANGPSAGSPYHGPNADWVHMVLATVGAYKCDGTYTPPAPTAVSCQRDAKIREAQAMAVTTECLAASGEETRSSALATLVILDLKAAHELCTKTGEPSACETDAVLPCNKLPK